MRYCKKGTNHPPFDSTRCTACKSESSIKARAKRISRSQVPAQPVAEVMRAWASEHIVAVYDPQGLVALSEELGLSRRRVEQILRQECMFFDLADKIVTKLNVFAWFEEGSELNKIYNLVPLGEIDSRIRTRTPAPVRPGTQSWVAEKVGTSRVTVSRVLRGLGGAGPELSAKIIKAARAAGIAS